MTIKILFFGQLHDIVKATEISISEVKNTDDAIKILLKQFPELSSANYAIALNKKLVQQTTEVHDGDTIALMPPFSGG